ncbi:MAG: hypothetical protein CO099_09190 [Bdellovibrio sp. CG_4_9_14_3_um_filter_39_7]|nr:MAG: hypothetical protein CO099_09190 [Bdellovibrio sp. CG_4_9_14_3_um_filter_39_7]
MRFFLIPSMLLLPLAFSCVKNIDKSAMSINTNDEERVELLQHCEELESKGDILGQLNDIKQLMGDLFDLLEDLKADDDFTEAIKISKRINLLITEVQSKLEPQFTTARWNYEVQWKIDRTDFNDLLGAQFQRGFKITKFIPKSATFLGRENDEMLGKLKIRQDGNRLFFTFESIGSSLELCQLNRTRMMVIEVHYKNLVNHNFRRFNLISR